MRLRSCTFSLATLIAPNNLKSSLINPKLSMSGVPLVSAPKTLLVTSETDAASMVMHDSLIKLGQWTEISTDKTKQKYWGHANGNVWMTRLKEPMIMSDNIDSVFVTDIGIYLTDVIFLSKHSAASGQPSLTVHPIGIPVSDNENKYGGIKGKFPPPNPRLSQFYNALERNIINEAISNEMQITFEVTHHGPYLDTPAMFCEIGSTESHWGRTDAGELWAKILSEMLNFESNQKKGFKMWFEMTETERKGSVVFVNLGGGHYAPKCGDMAKKGAFVGHMLANYAFDWGEKNNWKETISEAVASTRKSFVGGSLCALIDKKSFKSEQRKKIEETLSELEVPFSYKKEDLLENTL